MRYNLACAEARAGRADAALERLAGAVEAGFGNVQQLRTDPDLVSLRETPRFAELVERADRNARPCVYDPRAREFDFWIGSWDVFSPQGRQVGTNRIETSLDGCVLTERWEGAAGVEGESISYFDVETGEWVQHWVDSAGGNIQLRGTFSEGAMRLSGTNVTRGQPTRPIRGIWTPLPEGRVRQLFEQSADGGETWSVWFDGEYVPAGKPAGDSP